MIDGSLTGEIAALTAAFLWAAATLMFGKLGQRISPLVLNGVKGVFAIAFILLTLLFQSLLRPTVAVEPQHTLPLFSLVCLLISGGIGIGLGDTAYFSAVNALGARRALLLETLAPPMTAVLAWIFLSERLSLAAAAGICLTLIGIAWVISERVPGSTQQVSWLGLKTALVATTCQSVGGVFSRAALVNTAVDPLQSALIRLLAGLIFMGGLVLFKARRRISVAQTASPAQRISPHLLFRDRRLLVWVAATAFFGTYLAIWLQQMALKYTAAGIAQSLMATSPLFVLPMALALGDRISWRSVCGAIVAMSGVWLLFSVK